MDDPLTPLGTTEREIAIRRRVHRLAEFYRHVFVYVIVNTGLWSINLWMLWGSAAQGKWYAYWALWPTLGWGIGPNEREAILTLDTHQPQRNHLSNFGR